MNTTAAWQYRREDDGIGVLTLDVPGRSANTLSIAVLEELGRVLDEIERAPPKGLMIRSGKASGFIAGADINEFTRFASEEEALTAVRRGQRLCDRIEALPCPTVAVIQGFALGGGMELALACTYRVGVDDGRLALGLPEVQLGIHPGFGGSVRSVRLVGVRPAMDMMLTGKTIRGEKAHRIGLVDALVPAAEAERVARRLLLDRPPRHRPPLAERALSWPLVRGFIAPALRRQVARRVRREHYPAPYAIVELWTRHGARGRAAFESEARSIASLFGDPTARNLIRVFQLQDRLKGIGAKAPDGGTQIRHVHVVGAGVMGGDIAAWCALRGFTVSLQDRELKYVEPALRRAAELFDKRVTVAEERAAVGARLTADVEGARVPEADLVIEAIFENLEAKRALYASLLPRMKPTAILATNTSSLVLESLSGGMAGPGRFVGLHFFNPVAQMPLVEVIESPATDPATAAAAAAFVRRIDKLPLPCRSSPGFLVNRVLIPYMQEAMVAVEQGIDPEVVDAAATAFGMPMGPIELADVVGLDVCRHVGEIIGAAIGRTPPVTLSRIESLVAAGQLGRKSGQGYYRWVEGKAVKRQVNDTEIPADLTDRLMLTFANECVACLRERIVADADLIDAGMIFGAGFAPFRGGPMAWIRSEGPAVLRERLSRLRLQHGSRFEPDPGWSGL
ncbi:MAG: 3-hydroxyacyl-CoA dehydrogenase NAD-binding domain-containing protein [Pseudomonadota bacterium]|jgi:3-hydroxyacyl-CoA dehydrogenase/enoyl-CoA hydratase/3-hydroxybutyryl-CoA epimerase|nr:MAG: 3-hydroxyacyl-CoA dehydrogenase [Pseudomonadota bacterium]